MLQYREAKASPDDVRDLLRSHPAFRGLAISLTAKFFRDDTYLQAVFINHLTRVIAENRDDSSLHASLVEVVDESLRHAQGTVEAAKIAQVTRQGPGNFERMMAELLLEQCRAGHLPIAILHTTLTALVSLIRGMEVGHEVLFIQKDIPDHAPIGIVLRRTEEGIETRVLRDSRELWVKERETVLVDDTARNGHTLSQACATISSRLKFPILSMRTLAVYT